MTTFEKVRSLVAETLQINPEKIEENSPLLELSKDSIQLFELLLAFEKQYSFEVTYDQVVHLHTVDDVTNFIEQHSSR